MRKRRQLLIALGAGALAPPLAALAQPAAAKVYRIGFLGISFVSGYVLYRIFKGEKPGDIPFERAAKFDTIVNLRTARALGIRIPESFRLRADRVIE